MVRSQKISIIPETKDSFSNCPASNFIELESLRAYDDSICLQSIIEYNLIIMYDIKQQQTIRIDAQKVLF